MSTITAPGALFFQATTRPVHGWTGVLALLAATLRLRPHAPAVPTAPATQQPDAADDCWSGEDITGPVGGLFFASYTVREVDGYRAYTKVCQSRPLDVWNAAALMKIAGPVCIDKAESVRKVMKVARQRLGISADGRTQVRLVTAVERYQIRRAPVPVAMTLGSA